MPRVLPLLGAFALPAASAARLADVPRTVGDWDGEAVEVDARQLAQAEAAGHLSRRTPVWNSCATSSPNSTGPSPLSRDRLGYRRLCAALVPLTTGEGVDNDAGHPST